MTPDPLPVALPKLPEPAAHMYPSDLERFQSKETFAQAFSVAVGNPDERSVPLFTLSDMVAHAEAALRAQAEEVAALRAAIDKIRQSVSPKGPRPCDCERCDCHNSGSWAQVVAWDEAASMVAAIDVHLAASKQEKP